MDTQLGGMEKVEQSPFHGWWDQAAFGGRLCLGWDPSTGSHFPKIVWHCNLL